MFNDLLDIMKDEADGNIFKDKNEQYQHINLFF